MPRLSKYGVNTNSSGIYMIKNINNGKVYIGSAKKIVVRLSQHIHELKGSKHHNTHLQNAWNKYGEKSFICGVIEVIDNENMLTQFEQKYFNYYHSCNQKFGYNIAPIAKSNLGCKHTKGKKEKSVRMRGKGNNFFGKKHTEETKERIGFNNFQRKLSNKDIDNIKYLYKNENLTQTKIAKMFGVTPPHISKIVNNKRRKTL